MIEFFTDKSLLYLAIVGGGNTCKSLLEQLQKNTCFKIAGVSDINPQADGFLFAKELGINTTDNFHDFFEIKELDAIIDLTNNKRVFLDLIRNKPDRIGILERPFAFSLINLFVSQQKQKITEQQAILEKMSSDLLFQQTNAAILVLNTDFTIFDANEAYLKLVRKSKPEIIGLPCYKVTRGFDSPCPDSQPEFKCPMLETLKTGESAYTIQEIPISKNRVIYCNTVAYPLKDHEGNIVRIIELRKNITEEIASQWEKRIRALKADMKKSIQEDRMISLGKLVASCVHEINNPIQGMLTFSHLMQMILAEGNPDEKELEKFKKFLCLISDELERCGNIVSGLLSFSRESPTEYKDIILNQVIDSVITLTKHKMELQNISLITDIFPSPLVICGDMNQLQQCLLNLIFNAIEAMPEGGELSVNLKLDETEKNVQIEIDDTGYGIPEKNLDHIFDPFFTTKEEGKGTGLGLSIAYGVTKNHGGSIKVNSQKGKGSSFILIFPLRKLHSE